MSDDTFRFLRAVLRNAVTWSAAWAAVGGALFTAIVLFDPGPGIESLVERLGMALFSGVGWAIRFGIAGAVIGAVFSIVIRLGYRGRRLADIDARRFAMLGAVVGGVGVPLYMQTMNVLFGDGPIAWGLVLDDAPWAAVFGAAAAAGSILLARRAAALPHGARPQRLEGVRNPGDLPAVEQRETPLSPRSPPAQS
ncbi:MAG: hypothetical protein ACREMH_02710 [Gemmatimonadales bacterium]